MSPPRSPQRGIVLSEAAQESVVAELAAVLEQHLGAKRGISGMAMKLGFNTLRAARPDVAQRAVRSLLPEVLTALNALQASARPPGGDLVSLLREQGGDACELVLARLDARVATSHNATAKALYQRFRGSAAEELQALLPTLGTVLSKHLG